MSWESAAHLQGGMVGWRAMREWVTADGRPDVAALVAAAGRAAAVAVTDTSPCSERRVPGCANDGGMRCLGTTLGAFADWWGARGGGLEPTQGASGGAHAGPAPAPDVAASEAIEGAAHAADACTGRVAVQGEPRSGPSSAAQRVTGGDMPGARTLHRESSGGGSGSPHPPQPLRPDGSPNAAGGSARPASAASRGACGRRCLEPGGLWYLKVRVLFLRS
jgi:hypothetical protein